MKSALRNALLSSLRRLVHGLAIEYRTLDRWPTTAESGWTGPAATARFNAGEAGNYVEGMRGDAEETPPPAVRENLEALARTGLLHARLLDFGCGGGAYAELIARCPATRDWEYTGVDVNQKVVEACRARFPRSRFECVPAGARLPFPDGSFDVVLASGVLQCIEHPEGALAELHRVTAKWLVLTRVPVFKFEPSRIVLQKVWHRWGREAHAIHVFNRGWLEALCRETGFDLEARDWGSGWFTLPGCAEPAADMTLVLGKR